MKAITAIVQPFRLEYVREALILIGIAGLTVTECCGHGRLDKKRPSGDAYADIDGAVDLVPYLMLELTVPDAQVATVTEAIIANARTGRGGDGKIFIASVEEAVRIRTEERSDMALA